MIELTNEMVEAALEAHDDIYDGQRDPDAIKGAIRAAFAIVERDNAVIPKMTAEQLAALTRPKRRLKECVERWPDAQTCDYDPRCCRFPKSCSATVYDDEHVTEDDLEPLVNNANPPTT